MTEKSRNVSLVGIVQVLLAASFVIWLLFFPQKGDLFAWPVTPVPTAMFIGAGFIVRTMIGYFLWRERYWYRLRWQALGNYAFLALIFLATYWHINEMNWETSIVVAHIWVVAYTVEPLLLPLMEPRGEKRKEPFPDGEKRGPVKMGLRIGAAAGMWFDGFKPGIPEYPLALGARSFQRPDNGSFHGAGSSLVPGGLSCWRLG